MKKIITMLAIVAFFVSVQSVWATKDAGCGLGTMIFKDKESKLFNILAATTNGSSGNQTFAITSGTSECQSSAFVMNDKKSEVFVTDNYEFLMNDTVKQNGEYLTVYGGLMGCAGAQAQFAQVMQAEFDNVFASEKAVDVISSTKLAIVKDPVLKSSCVI